MKQFICSCVSPDLKELGCEDANEFSDLIENAEEITEAEFLAECREDLEEFDYTNILKEMFEYPYDFEYFKNGKIYFYRHSMIEYFFK